MSSRTLYDQGVTQAQWGEQLLHTKPCVNVHLQHEPSFHFEACQTERDKALKVTLQMLDAVLTRSASNTEAVISSSDFIAKSTVLLHPVLLHSHLLSSSRHLYPSVQSAPTSLFLPPLQQKSPLINLCDREYFVDSVCRSVRTLVELDVGLHLFNELGTHLRNYVSHIIQLLSSGGETDTDRRTLFVHFSHAWGHYYLAVIELQEVWVFFDRWYMFKAHSVKSIEGLAIEILREGISVHPWLLPLAQEGYLECLERDLAAHASGTVESGGDGDQNFRRELRLFTDLCFAVRVYFPHVEPPIVSLVSKFCCEEADRMWNTGFSTEMFFRKVEQLLEQCRERVNTCLLPYSLAKLERATQSCLLLDHGIKFLERDFARLAEEKNYDCFRRAWKLLACGKYVRLGKQCSSVFRAYVLEQGTSIMRRFALKPLKEDMFGIVKAMIELLHRGESVIAEGFSEESATFSIQLRDALSEALQEYQLEFAEQLARYLDWVMRESHGNTTAWRSDCNDEGLADEVDSDVNFEFVRGVLDDIGRIYSLFPSKDVFEGFYWRDFARRLLYHPRGRPRIVVEGYFVQRLREVCGSDAAKFEGMINDLMSSEELNNRFHLWVAGEDDGARTSPPTRINVVNEEEEQEGVTTEADVPHKGEENEEENPEVVGAALAAVDVKLNVLTDGHWPQQKPLAIALPLQLRALVKCMERFYRDSFSDRRLIWLHQLSSAVIKSTIGGTRRQMSGTLIQATILLVLQEQSYVGEPSEELCASVGDVCGCLGLDISLPDVIGAVLGLCHPKFPLLVRSPGPLTLNRNQCEGDGTTGYGSSVGVAAAPLLATDVLRVNHSFAVASQFCRIPFLGARRRGGDGSAGDRVADKEVERAMDDVMKDRMHVVDAAVVRLMKQRHRASHEEIMEEMPKLVRFPVTDSVVQDSLQRLTERGFLERGNSTKYTYIS